MRERQWNAWHSVRIAIKSMQKRGVLTPKIWPARDVKTIVSEATIEDLSAGRGSVEKERIHINYEYPANNDYEIDEDKLSEPDPERFNIRGF